MHYIFHWIAEQMLYQVPKTISFLLDYYTLNNLAVWKSPIRGLSLLCNVPSPPTIWFQKHKIFFQIQTQTLKISLLCVYIVLCLFIVWTIWHLILHTYEANPKSLRGAVGVVKQLQWLLNTALCGAGSPTPVQACSRLPGTLFVDMVVIDGAPIERHRKVWNLHHVGFWMRKALHLSIFITDWLKVSHVCMDLKNVHKWCRELTAGHD